MNNPKISIAQNPNGMLDQGDQKEHNFFLKCSCWFIQILDWGLLLALILVFIKGLKIAPKISIAFAVIHFIYIITELLTPTGKYLCNKSSDEDMRQKMGRYFRTPPKIIFHCECYHNEIIHYTTTDKLGRVQHHTRTEKVITYKEDYENEIDRFYARNRYKDIFLEFK